MVRRTYTLKIKEGCCLLRSCDSSSSECKKFGNVIGVSKNVLKYNCHAVILCRIQGGTSRYIILCFQRCYRLTIRYG
ncbi:hypothetical protein ElyMa_004569700 [Elysia marginata]|uniref:Uncharacterized protein n=1 Tax=Elysia marginata TaxID=1093978 RepID=A0AAV4HW26_9GAST|nr:hypothetical protein ElyMa_004569700 [Elysia marginata]